MRPVDWIAKHLAEESPKRIARTIRARRQRGALCAYRAKQFWICESDAQRAVSAHGNAADGAPFAVFAEVVLLFDRGHELAQKEIAVEDLIVRRVDVKACLAFGGDDQEIADFVLLA